MAFLTEDTSIKTLLGEHSAIKGNLVAKGYMRVEGDIDGNVETDGVLWIGEKARVRGNVTAKSIIVGGIIHGNITAPAEAKLLSGSVVMGDVSTHRLQVEDNVIVHGHCISLLDNAKYTESLNRHTTENAFKNKFNFNESH